MPRLRKVVFWCHLVTAGVVGVVILLMSLTGVLLAFERQIVGWADRSAVTVVRTGDRLTAEALLAAVHGPGGEAPASLTISSDPAAPAVVGFSRGRTRLVDPYDGADLGEGSARARATFRTIEDIHRWLALSGGGRTAGRFVTGASNLAFLFIVLSGLYLWVPRTFGRAQFRNALWFRRGLSSRARDFNWHNTIGFWMWVPLVVVVSSGVVMSYGWANDLVYRVAGEQPPPPRSGPPGGPPREAGKVSTVGLDRLVARAATQVPGWQAIGIQLPSSDDAPVTFSIDAGSGGQPQYRAQLTLDRTTARVTKWEPFASASTGRRWRTFLRFAHTGEYFGLAGQAVASLASAGAAVLVWTGLAMAWRRYRGWGRRRSRGGTIVGPAAETEPLRDEEHVNV